MQVVKAQVAQESAGGFLAIPRAFVRGFWHLLRLKEIAFLVALVDLADGRWSMPLALVQIAKIAHLSAGAAREVVAQLERAGLVTREPLPHAPGVYRWGLAHEGEALSVAQKLAHRPRLKVKARPPQLELPLAAALEPPPPPPAPPPAPRPRLALVPPPLAGLASCPPVAAGNSPATEPPPPPVVEVPDAPKTEPCPAPLPDPGEAWPVEGLDQVDQVEQLAGVELEAPPLVTALGLTVEQIARWASLATPDETEGERLEPPAPVQASLPLGPPQIRAPRGPSTAPQIGALTAPNRGAPPAPNQGGPRPKSGRPYLMISRHDLQTEIPTDPPDASPSAEAPTSAQAAGGMDLEFLGELAAMLCPGLPRETAAARIADLPGATTALAVAFLREAIPAAKARGARFPFGAALSTWSAWRGAQKAPRGPVAPLLPPAPVAPPRRPGEARPVAALADRADFLAKVRAARQALQRVAPPAQPISPGSLETNTDD